MNSEQNKPIKLPVSWDEKHNCIRDADGEDIASPLFSYEGLPIISALNEADALRAEVDEYREFIKACSYIEGEIEHREFVFEVTGENDEWSQRIPFPSRAVESPLTLFQEHAALKDAGEVGGTE